MFLIILTYLYSMTDYQNKYKLILHFIAIIIHIKNKGNYCGLCANLMKKKLKIINIII